MEPITMSLLIIVLGNVAGEVIKEACKDYLKDKLKLFFGRLEKLGERDKVEHAYQDAMEQAYVACIEMLLLNIKGFGYSDEELKQYKSSIVAFIKDDEVAEELLRFVREPGCNDLPSPDVLRERWKEMGGQELPSDTLWNAVAIAFRRKARKQTILSDDLRKLLNAQNLQQLKELIERQGGVKVPVRRDKYSQRMLTKFSPVDLANLMPAYADDPGQMVIRDVFIAQNVRENPPPVEIPKDLADHLKKDGRYEADDDTAENLDEQWLKELHTVYVNQSPKPVLDVIAAPGNRLLVLTGEPGSGKSTLMRYLLTGIIEPPVDRKSGKPLPWTLAFEDAFPLLIELRDFYALRRSGECDSFLEYVAFMGKTDQWFLDDHAVQGSLDNGPSLVMFDGLDEIFDPADRERVIQEIAGFAQRYPRARIVVTSRPVDYKEQVLRDAGFAHFGMQDLNDGQIETFIRGWFALTFPQQPQQAEQRIERVLGSVRRSKPIRLLAGNPMLLTIMSLLAREEELPRERAKFYEKAVEVLCHHWDANRNLQLPEDRHLNADDKKDLLRRIAMQMQSGKSGLKGNIIGEDDLEQEIQGFLIDEQWQPNTAEAKKAARRMIRQLRERNYILCLRGPHLYGFVHRTFLEYLTAAEYVRRFDRQPQQITIEELVALFERYCRDDEWREVLRLICGQINEQFVGHIVEHLVELHGKRWNGQEEAKELLLSIYCLSEVRNLAKIKSVVTTLRDQLVEVYRSDTYSWQLNNLTNAAKEIGGRWPKLPDVAGISHSISNVSSFVTGSGRIWVHFAAMVGADRALICEFASDKHPNIREGALEVLAEKWPDDRTRKLLEDRAVNDENYDPRSYALEALVKKWPDDRTRKLLEDRAVNDENEAPRSSAFETLAEKWPDDRTRKLLEDRAVNDENEAPRSSALETLVKKWPDDRTRKPLEDRASADGFAASYVGWEHSQFGRIVFTKDLDGISPYLDPAQPISRDHIERAAKEADVPDDEVDETVRSLSEHMGWDITKGSAGQPR